MDHTHHISPFLLTRAEAGDPAAMLELAQVMDTKNQPLTAWKWLQQATNRGHTPAQTQTATWLIAGHNVARNTQAGFELMRTTALTGDLTAQHLLSVLYAMGYTGEIDWDAAITWLIRGARAGSVQAIRQLAVLIRPLPHLRPLRHTLYYSAAAAGDDLAAYLLGRELCLSSDSTEHAQGIGWILQSADHGNAAALLHSKNLIGETLRKPGSFREVKRIPWADIRRLIVLPHTANLPEQRVLSTNPSIKVRQGMLNPALCGYMISAGARHLRAATVHDSQAGEISDQSRTNRFANFRLLESDIVVQSVNARIMRAMNHPVTHADPLSLLHYRPGEHYKPHYDFFDPAFLAHQQHLKTSGQRIRTGLTYLNTGYGGGVTRFWDINFDFRAGLGDFLSFGNVTPDGSPDRKTLHSGEPPTSGDKWLLSKWARASHVPL